MTSATRRPRSTEWAMGKGRTPTPAGMYILFVGWIILGVSPALFTSHDLMLALGRIGTPGLLKVVSCEDLGEGRYDCVGRFTPDDASMKPIAVQAAPESKAGQSRRAQLDPDDARAIPTGTAGVLAKAGLMALTPFVFAAFPYSLLFVLRIRRGRGTAAVLGVLVAVASLAMVVVGLVAAYQ